VFLILSIGTQGARLELVSAEPSSTFHSLPMTNEMRLHVEEPPNTASLLPPQTPKSLQTHRRGVNLFTAESQPLASFQAGSCLPEVSVQAHNFQGNFNFLRFQKRKLILLISPVNSLAKNRLFCFVGVAVDATGRDLLWSISQSFSDVEATRPPKNPTEPANQQPEFNAVTPSRKTSEKCTFTYIYINFFLFVYIL